MAKTLNPAYRRRKNFKKSLRRRVRRRLEVMKPMSDATLATYFAVKSLTPKQCFELHVGAHLTRIKTIMREFRFLRSQMNFNPAPNKIDSTLVNAPHDHQVVKLSTRPMKLHQDLTIRSFDQIKILSDLVISPSMTAYHRCHCREDSSLRIFSKPGGGDFYFRCHACGTCYTSLEMLRNSRFPTLESWPAVAQTAHEEGIIAEPLTKQALDTFLWAHHWRNILPMGREAYAGLVKAGEVSARFGDWCIMSKNDLGPIVHDLGRSTAPLRQRHWVRVLRNLFGYVCGVVIYDDDWYPWLDIRFTDDQLVLDSPRWADFVDWSKDMVVCPDDKTATAIERAVATWPERDRIAIATIADVGKVPAIYSRPYERLWLPVHAEAPAGFGLHLTHAAAATRVPWLGNDVNFAAKGLTKGKLCNGQHPQHLDFLAAAIVADGRPLRSMLATILGDRTIPLATGQELVAKIASRANITKDELAAAIEINSNPFAVQIGKATYTCREGKFFKRAAKAGEFVPISNFSVRIEATKPGVGGNPALDLVLSIGPRSTTLSVTELVFRNSKKLWRAIRIAATTAGLDVPMMYTVPDRKLLPEIIRGTHAS